MLLDCKNWEQDEIKDRIVIEPVRRKDCSVLCSRTEAFGLRLHLDLKAHYCTVYERDKPLTG